MEDLTEKLSSRAGWTQMAQRGRAAVLAIPPAGAPLGERTPQGPGCLRAAQARATRPICISGPPMWLAGAKTCIQSAWEGVTTGADVQGSGGTLVV